MLAHLFKLRRTAVTVLRLAFLAFILVSCTNLTQVISPPNVTDTPPVDAPSPAMLAETIFKVALPQPLAEGQRLFIEIVDEVTGLGLNPGRGLMEAETPNVYSIKLSYPLGSAIKYRYVLDVNGAAQIEYTTRGQQVRYRMYYVKGPGAVDDVVSAWRFSPSTANLGRIQGQVSELSSNAPIVNALVLAGGMQTFTASDGSFLLEGLPPGIHNVVVYSLDGNFDIFQQGAVVAPDSTTQAFIQTSQAKKVNVTFIVTPPAGNLKGAPVRMVGNIYSLGNTFADLRGGISVLASRAPLMKFLEDGTYMLTLELPVGLDLQYKYTLGDGFWNAEYTNEGRFKVRQLIVPNKDTVITETIDTWVVKDNTPITFVVSVPETTPVNDVISIQFNPYGWTEPLPMWPGGANRWFYILYNPLHMLKNASYRYCRSEQCGIADAVNTAGPKAQGIPFDATGEKKSFTDTVSEWAFQESTGDPMPVTAVEIPAQDGFKTGVEFVPAYHPSWQPYITWGFENARQLKSNNVILTPTWHWTQVNPPVIEPVAGSDPLWADMTMLGNQANQRGLDVIVHPVSIIPGDSEQWWAEGHRDDGWWQSWFDRYRTFLIYHADLASQMGAKGLVIGDDTIFPALPNGSLADGSPSGVPANAGGRWLQLIADVRSRYSGTLYWMLPVTQPDQVNAPQFLLSVDQVIMRVSAPIANGDQPGQDLLGPAAARLLDEIIYPVQQNLNKQVVLSLLYPSAPGSAAGCVIIGEPSCLSAFAIQQPGLTVPGTSPDYRQQADIYRAYLEAVLQRPWINGFFSSGYYPTTGLRDHSSSIRNKPAADILWYWYPRLTGEINQVP